MSAKAKNQCNGAEQITRCNGINIRFSPTEDRAELKNQMQNLAGEIAAGLTKLEPAESKELLEAFVSALLLSVSKESRREERRQKQAEGIAAARARGVRLGRPRVTLPENFYEVCIAWKNREISLSNAAKACGMPESTFYDRARKVAAAVKKKTCFQSERVVGGEEA